MRILYGTTNSAKIKHMKEMLDGMEIEIIGLDEVCKKVPKVIENGITPLENAKKKAKEYFKNLKFLYLPVVQGSI